MSDKTPRVLHLTPPVGTGVQCKAVARERANAPWSSVLPLIQEILAHRAPAGSVFKSYDIGWATFATPDGSEMRFDLRVPLKLHEGAAIAPTTTTSN